LIRYNAQDGLVSVLADDMTAIQDAVYQNISDRLGIILKRHGIKGDSGHLFSLSGLPGAAVDEFNIQCSGIGPVVFGDYIYVNYEEEGPLEVSTILANGSSKYLYLKKSLSYSNDQEGNFKDGHPVDADGNPPASGYYIESEYELSLAASALGNLPTESIVILAKVTRAPTGSELLFVDLRRRNALSINDFGLIQPNNTEIEDLSVSSLYQSNIIKSRSYSSDSINKAPSQTDMTANKLYFKVSWSSNEDAFGYQLQLQILDPQGKAALSPISEIVPHVEGEDKIYAHAEVIPGLKYRVSVRSLSGNPNHDPGPWTSEDVYAGVPDLTESISIPEISVESVHGEGETSFVRHMVNINVTPSESTPEPYYIQIFRSPTALTGQSIVDSAIMIYEGNAPSFKFDIPPNTTCYFSGRVVYPGNICSPMVHFEDSFIASKLVEDVPLNFYVRIPIAIFWIEATDQNPFKLASFQIPAPYCRLKGMEFRSHGSVILTTGDTKIGIELVADVKGSFPFLDGATNGKTANTDRKIEWDYNDFPQKGSTTTALTPDEYYQVGGSMSLSPNERGTSWNIEDELTVWMCAYDLDGGTSHIILAGDLELVFEKTAEEMQ